MVSSSEINSFLLSAPVSAYSVKDKHNSVLCRLFVPDNASSMIERVKSQEPHHVVFILNVCDARCKAITWLAQTLKKLKQRRNEGEYDGI